MDLLSDLANDFSRMSLKSDSSDVKTIKRMVEEKLRYYTQKNVNWEEGRSEEEIRQIQKVQQLLFSESFYSHVATMSRSKCPESPSWKDYETELTETVTRTEANHGVKLPWLQGFIRAYIETGKEVAKVYASKGIKPSEDVTHNNDNPIAAILQILELSLDAPTTDVFQG